MSQDDFVRPDRRSAVGRCKAFVASLLPGSAGRRDTALACARLSRGLVQGGSDTILVCDERGTIIFEHPAGGRTGTLLSAVMRASDQPRFADFWQRLLAGAAIRTTEFCTRTVTDRWTAAQVTAADLRHDPAVRGILLTVRLKEQPRHAYCDELTGLPDAGLFRDRLEQALLRAGRRRGAVGLLAVNIDNFAQVNDRLGFEAGDRLLTEAAGRLRACVRAQDTVARQDGDAFAVILDDLNGDEDALPAAKAITEQFRRPFLVAERDVVLTASIGIALSDPLYPSADSVIRNAGVALQRAKRDGKARHVVFRPAARADGVGSLELECELRQAVEKDELRVHYQPVVDMASGEIIEVEALVRWQHPSRGMISPAGFLRAAEETGLIIQLGKWVLEAACLQLADWHRRFPSKRPLTLGVNLSARQFHRPFLLADVIEALLEAGLPARCLRLGISEATIMRDVGAASRALWELKELGLRIAVDNFGTGSLSAADLKRLPLDVIKIDSLFVGQVNGDPKAADAVRRIIALARSLDLRVAGERIETAEQAALLKAWGCDQGQGYFFGKPLDATQTGILLAKSPGRAIKPAQP